MTFREWIGFRRHPDYAAAPWLGPIVGAAITVIALAVVVGGVATLVQFLFQILKLDANHEAIRNLGLILIAVLSAPFVIWRAVVAQKQADTAEQSHITDQINKAVDGLGSEKSINKIGRPVKILMGESNEFTHYVENYATFELEPKSIELRRYFKASMIDNDGGFFEGLHIDVRTWEEERTEIEWQDRPLAIREGEKATEFGSWSVFSESRPNIEVRVGAIYALERIAQDSLRDHIQIMEILTAYIRENAPVRDLELSEEPLKIARTRSDVQAALDVIGRRARESILLEHSKQYRLDLREVDLSGANLSKGNFEGALFDKSRLEASNFRSTNLRGARLQACRLNFANFFDANLCGAIIDHAISKRGGSIAHAANIRGLSMAGSDLSAIEYFPTENTHSPTFGTKDTKLGGDLMARRHVLESDIKQFVRVMNGREIENEGEVRERLSRAGFLFWSPYDATDGATECLRSCLWSHIGLTGFPYHDV